MKVKEQGIHVYVYIPSPPLTRFSSDIEAVLLAKVHEILPPRPDSHAIQLAATEGSIACIHD